MKRSIFELEAGCSDDSDCSEDSIDSITSSDVDFIDNRPLHELDYTHASEDISKGGTPPTRPPRTPKRPTLKRTDTSTILPPQTVGTITLKTTTGTMDIPAPDWGRCKPAQAIRTPAPDVDTDKGQRVRRFTMTLNNYTPQDLENFKSLPNTKYKCVGEEVGEQGTPHLQAYIEFDNKYSIKKVQQELSSHWKSPSRWAVFVSKGTGPQNREYCSKDGKFWEHGQQPKGQGKRSDLDKVGELCIDGANIKDIAIEHPKSFIQYSRGILALHQLVNSTPRSEMTLGYWIYGATGTGKSRWAHSLSPESTYSKDPMTKYFCGYKQQDTVLLDDFRPNPEMNFSFLLRLADRYPINVQTKFGNAEFNSKRIIVTSPLSIDEAYAGLDTLRDGQIAQLKRRFKEIHFGPEGFNHLLRLVDINHPANADEEVTQQYDNMDQGLQTLCEAVAVAK